MKTLLNKMIEWYTLSAVCFISWISLDKFIGITFKNYLYALLIHHLSTTKVNPYFRKIKIV